MSKTGKSLCMILKLDKKQEFYITQSWGNLNYRNISSWSYTLKQYDKCVYFVNGGSSTIVFQRALSNYLTPLFELNKNDLMFIIQIVGKWK